jgi:hypothetical protein
MIIDNQNPDHDLSCSFGGQKAAQLGRLTLLSLDYLLRRSSVKSFCPIAGRNVACSSFGRDKTTPSLP